MVQIGAEIAQNIDAQGEKPPVGVERHFGHGHIVAPLRVADEMLASVARPADRPSEPAGRGENERIFPVDHLLGAEAAADVLGDHAKESPRNLQNFVGDDVPDAVDALAPDVEGEAAGLRIVLPDRGAGLHVVGDDARIDNFDSDRPRRLRECGVGFLLVADMIVIGDVVGRAGEDQRRPGPDGLFHVDDRGKLFPSDADQFGGVAPLKRRIGDDHRDDVADMIGLALRHHRIRLQRRPRLVGVRNRSNAGQRCRDC